MDRLRRLARWARPYLELRIAVALLLVVTLGLAFAELTDEVLDRETDAIDRTVFLAFREPNGQPIGPRWMAEVGRDITALGGVSVLMLLTVAVLGYLWLRRAYRMGWVLLAGFAGASIATMVLKDIIDRPRPALVPHLTEVYSASFPSGHSAMAAATYLTLGMLLARVHSGRRMKAYLVGVMIVVTVLVGVSRIYVGVHWPTDVLAGWALGTLWAIGVWTVARWWELRGLRARGPTRWPIESAHH